MTNRAVWFMRAVFEDRLFSSSPSQHQAQLSPGGCRGRRGRFHVWRTASSWAPWRRAYCWRGFEKRWVVSSAPPASRPAGQLLTTPHRTPHTCEQDFQLVMASMAKSYWWQGWWLCRCWWQGWCFTRWDGRAGSPRCCWRGLQIFLLKRLYRKKWNFINCHLISW